MARSKKKKDVSPKRESPDPLAPGIAAFDAGDYVVARQRLGKLAEDDELSESQREQARDMVNATKLEPATLYVGLACIVLFLLAVSITVYNQP